MENIKFYNEEISSQSFSDMSISKFIAVECKFVDCSFRNMKIKDICFGSGIKQSKYINCDFDNSVFSSIVPGVARFENCSFKNVKINKLFCVDIEMINCIISGEIAQGNFIGIRKNLDGSQSINEFRNNDFTNLKLGDVGFFGIDLKAQKLPISEDFIVIDDVKSFIAETKANISTIKNISLSSSVSKVLNILDLESEGGNNQLFVDKNSFPKNLEDAVRVVFSRSLD